MKYIHRYHVLYIYEYNLQFISRSRGNVRFSLKYYIFEIFPVLPTEAESTVYFTSVL